MAVAGSCGDASIDCTRPPGGRSGGVTSRQVAPSSTLTWKGPSYDPTQITPRRTGLSSMAYSVE